MQGFGFKSLKWAFGRDGLCCVGDVRAESLIFPEKLIDTKTCFSYIPPGYLHKQPQTKNIPIQGE